MSEPLPAVTRVHTERGSHIEPPLQDDWSDLEKLRWNLAVALHDADAPADLLTIEQANLTVGGRRVWDAYDLRGAGFSSGGGGFHYMWGQINGVRLGLRLGKRLTEANG